MRDWKAATITWEKRQMENQANKQSTTKNVKRNMGKIENMSVLLGPNKEKRGLFQGVDVSNIYYLPFNLDYSLELVEGIGKDRNPKFRIDDENRFTYENLINGYMEIEK